MSNSNTLSNTSFFVSYNHELGDSQAAWQEREIKS